MMIKHFVLAIFALSPLPFDGFSPIVLSLKMHFDKTGYNFVQPMRTGETSRQ